MQSLIEAGQFQEALVYLDENPDFKPGKAGIIAGLIQGFHLMSHRKPRLKPFKPC